MGWPPISDIRMPVLGLVRRMVFATPSMMSFFTWQYGQAFQTMAVGTMAKVVTGIGKWNFGPF